MDGVSDHTNMQERIHHFSSLDDEDAELEFFRGIKQQIKEDLRSVGTAIEHLSKMREKAANLEADLVMKIDCATWKNVSEFIGMSATILDGGMQLEFANKENETSLPDK